MELLLRGGRVIDPLEGLVGERDIAICCGKIAQLGEKIPSREGLHVIDITGKIVAAGLVDIHGHFYDGLSQLALKADQTCLPTGVVAAVDAGTAGWPSCKGFLDYIVPANKTELFCFVNLSSLGLLPSAAALGELTDLRFVSEEKLQECLRVNADRVVGIKVRCSHRAAGVNALPALRMAIRIAEKIGTRVMVHLSDSPVPTVDLLRELRPGDIATHIFHGFPGNIINEDGHIHPDVLKAQESGVILDVGHGGIHFDIEVARRAILCGLWPNTISTDRHQPPPGRITYNLLDIMSEFMALGMPIEHVIARASGNAAAAIDKAGKFGGLRVGEYANLAIFCARGKPFHLSRHVKPPDARSSLLALSAYHSQRQGGLRSPRFWGR